MWSHVSLKQRPVTVWLARTCELTDPQTQSDIVSLWTHPLVSSPKQPCPLVATNDTTIENAVICNLTDLLYCDWLWFECIFKNHSSSLKSSSALRIIGEASCAQTLHGDVISLSPFLIFFKKLFFFSSSFVCSHDFWLLSLFRRYVKPAHQKKPESLAIGRHASILFKSCMSLSRSLPLSIQN